MANSSTVIKITHAAAGADVLRAGALRGASEMHFAAEDVRALLESISAGNLDGSFSIGQSTSAPARASGTLTLSSASGAVGGVINGVTITDTASGGDTASAALVAAAINASTNALVAGIVTASSAAAVVTVTAIDATKTGNAITLVASGTGVTASGARLTGGTGGDAVATVYTGH